MTPEGLAQARYREYKGRKPTQCRMFFDGVLYFGWPNKPSSGTMRILHWDVFLCSKLPEIRKTRLVKSVN